MLSTYLFIYWCLYKTTKHFTSKHISRLIETKKIPIHVLTYESEMSEIGNILRYVFIYSLGINVCMYVCICVNQLTFRQALPGYVS